MLIDHISNIKRYQNLHKHFPEICKYLGKTNIKALSVGRYDIIKDQAYISIDKRMAKDKKTAYLEAHRKYIDIQMIFSGSDTMGWKPILHCKKVQKEYDEGKDIIFYNDAPDFFVPVAPDFFVIFFPEDAHMPLIGIKEIHKAVVKVKV